MTFSFLLIGAIVAYGIAAGLVLRSVYSQSNHPSHMKVAVGMAIVAVALQITHILLMRLNGAPIDFSASTMALIICAVVVVIYLLGCLSLEIQKLGILVFPLAALSVLFSLFWRGNSGVSASPLWPLSAFSAHVLVSILAYSLLTIAAVQSVLYLYQEKQLQKRATPAALASLPPLQTMETLLFRLVGMGFVLLSATLFSGALFSNQLFGQAFEFNHHTVLASLGWLVFGALLIRRWRSGIRGLPATILTLCGFALIQLGYFGTKIVTEALTL